METKKKWYEGGVNSELIKALSIRAIYAVGVVLLGALILSYTRIPLTKANAEKIEYYDKVEVIQNAELKRLECEKADRSEIIVVHDTLNQINFMINTLGVEFETFYDFYKTNSDHVNRQLENLQN